MTKQQVINSLKKMMIDDAVEFKYCNVLKKYEVRVYLGDRVSISSCRSRDSIPAIAERLYCEQVSRLY